VFSTGEDMVLVNLVEKTYTHNYLSTYSRTTSPYIPLAERMYTETDGIPCYVYRNNATNCPLASYCVLPQELTFSYLKNFDLWSIENPSIYYLGRECIQISGTLSPYMAQKHAMESYTMLVDAQTGILMKLYSNQNGQCTPYITVTGFSTEPIVSKQFDPAQYTNYLEETR